MTKQVLDMNSTEFKPRNKFYLVEPKALRSEKVLESGLIIPLTGHETSVVETRPTSGVVVASCMPDNEEIDVDIDDMVIWPATDGIDLVFNDGNFLLIRDTSIIGKQK